MLLSIVVVFMCLSMSWSLFFFGVGVSVEYPSAFVKLTMAVASKASQQPLAGQLPLPVEQRIHMERFFAITCGNITGQLYYADFLSQKEANQSVCW